MALKTKSYSAEERHTPLFIAETHLLSSLASLKDVGSCGDEESNKAVYGEEVDEKWTALKRMLVVAGYHHDLRVTIG